MDDKRYNLLNEMHTHWKGLLEYLSKSYNNNNVGCINIKLLMLILRPNSRKKPNNIGSEELVDG